MTDRKKGKGMRILGILAGTCALVLLMLYMAGMFVPDKIGPGTVEREKKSVSPGEIVKAVKETTTEFYEAVGTVRPRRETSVESQVQGRILKVLVRPGDTVKEGDRLVVLDNREFRARLDSAKQMVVSARARKEQALQAVKVAEAAFTQAEAAHKRVQTYYKAEAATRQQLEEAESAFQQAGANVKQSFDGLKAAESGIKQAEKGVEEARIVQNYTEIRSNADGEVAKRLVEPGDMAFPGKALVVLQTRGALRLEALLPEGLIDRVKMGEELGVNLDALQRTVKGRVTEMVPFADPSTRSFLVKVDLPAEKGLYPGMFGRLLVSVGKIPVVWIPEKALRRVGQLEMVTARMGNDWTEIYVTTGKSSDGRLEILSGLNGGEEIAVRGEEP